VAAKNWPEIKESGSREGTTKLGRSCLDPTASEEDPNINEGEGGIRRGLGDKKSCFKQVGKRSISAKEKNSKRVF